MHRKRLLTDSSYWRPTVQRGPSEQSAKPTRPMALIGLLKVMMKNEIAALYELLFSR
jgi:hypothetical protein